MDYGRFRNVFRLSAKRCCSGWNVFFVPWTVHYKKVVHLEEMDHCHPPNPRCEYFVEFSALLSLVMVHAKPPNNETWWVPIVQAPVPLSPPICRIHDIFPRSQLFNRKVRRGSGCKVNSVRKSPSGEKRQGLRVPVSGHRGTSPTIDLKVELLSFLRWLDGPLVFIVPKIKCFQSYLGQKILGCSLKSGVSGDFFPHKMVVSFWWSPFLGL